MFFDYDKLRFGQYKDFKNLIDNKELKKQAETSSELTSLTDSDAETLSTSEYLTNGNSIWGGVNSLNNVENDEFTQEDYDEYLKLYNDIQQILPDDDYTEVKKLFGNIFIGNNEKIADDNKIEDNNEENKEIKVAHSKSDIKKLLNGMGNNKKKALLEKFGGIDKIDSITVSNSGTLKIKSASNSAVVYPSGNYKFTYETPDETGTQFFDSDNRILSNNFVSHKNNDSSVSENYTYYDDNSYSVSITDSSKPEEQINVICTPENNVETMVTQDISTGETTINYNMPPSNMGSCSPVSVNPCDNSSLSSQLDSLVQERDTVQNDLSTQQSEYQTTENQKNTELSSIDSEISSGEGELSGATSDMNAKQGEVTTCQGEVDSATAQADSAQAEADSKNAELETATQATDQAQQTSDTAAQENQQAAQQQQSAQSESDTAQNNLNTAVNNTNSAQSTADTTSANLSNAEAATETAFNVRNQCQSEVDSAQAEYNNAQAASSSEKSIIDKIKGLISSLFNKLQAALSKLSEADREAQQKEREEEHARSVDEEAQNALEQRKTEQDNAQTVLDASQVVLQRAIDEKSVSDQEYADALLDLADAMSEQDAASGEYQSALQEFMTANNYKVDAEGNLTNAQGELVSCQTIVTQLESMVQGLHSNRTQTETSYDNTLNTTMQVIQGDESQIQNLNNQISELQTQIEAENKKIAMEEQMVATLTAEKGEINAAEQSAGIWDNVVSFFGQGNAKDKKEFATKQEKLEAALKSNDTKAIEEAYKAIYGDKEVLVDDIGRVVETFPSELTEEEQKKCKTVKVSELSEIQLSTYVDSESKKASESSKLINSISSGAFTINGKTVSEEDLNAAMLAQAEQVVKDMEDAVKHQGIISQGLGKVNNLFGIGTSETEARAEVDHYKNMVNKLKNCSDPTQYAALYKEITGSNFDANSMVSLLAYNQMNSSNSSNTSKPASSSQNVTGQHDLTDVVTEVVNDVNSNGNGDKDLLSVTKDSKAAEKIEDYKATQDTAKTVAIAAASAVIATVAVAATPFTGGASLALAFAIGGAAGVALNAADSIYDSDGDKTLDFNYTWKDAAVDFVVNGVGAMSNGLGEAAGTAVAKSIGSSAAKNAVTTTFKEAAKKTMINVGSKLAGAAVDGYVDGAISSGADYILNTALDENKEFSMGDLITTTGRGGLTGMVLNTGFSGAGMMVKGGANTVKSLSLSSDINKALREGSSGNALADIIAPKLDSSLINNGEVNKFAVDQIMKNANDSLNALKKAGLSDVGAKSVLDNVSLDNMADLPKAIDAISKNADLFDFDTNKIFDSADNTSDFLKNIDNLEFNSKTGDLEGLSFKNGENNYEYKFNKKGNLESKLTEMADGTSSKIEFNKKGTQTITNFDADGNVVERIQVEKDGSKIVLDRQIHPDEIINNNKTDNIVNNNSKDIITKDNIKPFDSSKVDKVTPQDIIYNNNKDYIRDGNFIDKYKEISKNKQFNQYLSQVNFHKLKKDPGNITDEMMDDINKLYNAMKTGVDAENVFVPKFSSLDEAAKKINVGDVCRIDGANNIAIKLSNGSLKNLNMSSETYMQLFPPVSRYASFQGAAGDCYLISTVDALLKTPGTRHRILDCFTENADGSISVKIGEVTQNYTKNDLIRFSKLSGCDGIQMIESSYGYHVVNKRAREILDLLKNNNLNNIERMELDKELASLVDFDKLSKNITKLRDAGGRMEEVMETFKLENANYSYDFEKELSNPDFLNKYIFIGGTRGNGNHANMLIPQMKLAESHAYRIKPYLSDSREVLFKVTNPWNTQLDFSMNIYELKKYFNNIAYCKIS